MWAAALFSTIWFLIALGGAGAAESRLLPAFPGAEGFGAYAIGGRGGRVIAVTNVHDSGPGSLRAAVEERGPRIVVFKVSGVIELKTPLEVRQPFLTIAGQTAPGDGICLKAHYLRLEETHEVIIRHLRFRPGEVAGRDASDAVQIYRSQNVIIDHCSLSWSVDETIDIGDEWRPPYSGPHTDNVTVQWCIVSESLRKSAHEKGEHAYAALISALRDADITIHHNLFAHHLTRMPRPGGRRGSAGVRLEFRNNVIYDWGRNAPGYSADSDTAEVVSLSYVGNYLKPGPSTPDAGRRTAFNAAPPTFLHGANNEIEGFAEGRVDNSRLFKGGRPLAKPVLAPNTTVEAARVAWTKVLADAGATRPRRDVVDRRVVEQVKSGTGAIIDTTADVGGWPEYRSLPADADIDADGMADEWERRHRLDPKDGTDGVKDLDGDGYTNIEEFLNGTSPEKIE